LNTELAWRRLHVTRAAVVDDDHISQGTTTESQNEMIQMIDPEFVMAVVVDEIWFSGL
jgi:hypothetical protein